MKDYPYQYVVDVEHIDEDLDYFLHNVLDVRNKTDDTPLKVHKYGDPEDFNKWTPNYTNWAFEGLARNHMDVVEK